MLPLRVPYCMSFLLRNSGWRMPSRTSSFIMTEEEGTSVFMTEKENRANCALILQLLSVRDTRLLVTLHGPEQVTWLSLTSGGRETFGGRHKWLRKLEKLEVGPSTFTFCLVLSVLPRPPQHGLVHLHVSTGDLSPAQERCVSDTKSRRRWKLLFISFANADFSSTVHLRSYSNKGGLFHAEWVVINFILCSFFKPKSFFPLLSVLLLCIQYAFHSLGPWC